MPNQKELALMELAFTDSNGKKYYTYRNDGDLPLNRKAHLEIKHIELQSSFTLDEMKRLFEAQEKALSERDKNGRNQPNMAMVSNITSELKNRLEWLHLGNAREDILLDIISTWLIREDEDPAVLDANISKEKGEQIKTDAVDGGRSSAFFRTSQLERTNNLFRYITKQKEGIFDIDTEEGDNVQQPDSIFLRKRVMLRQTNNRTELMNLAQGVSTELDKIESTYTVNKYLDHLSYIVERNKATPDKKP